jgi:uncharacterized RDD family membrane protein YckC
MTGANIPQPPEPARLPRRLAALAYDTLLLAAILFAFTFLIVASRGGAPIPPGSLWFEGGLIGVAALFYGWFWTHGGQTLGMRAWRIRVTTVDGGALDWRRALLRFCAAWLAALPAGLGYWWGLFDPERRCWHDTLSGTRVVRVNARERAQDR